MNAARSLNFVFSSVWLMQSDALANIIAIAERMTTPEALAAKLGRPLDNTRTVERRDGVAIVPITGPVFRYANMFTNISGATSTQVLATDIQTALDDPSVKSIVLNIDSPGGEAAGINELANLIYHARAKKPIHAYIGGVGASGAYWIASAASTVTVDATALVGSIGVVMTYTDTQARDEKSGIKQYEIVSSASPDKRLDMSTQAGRAKAQATVDSLAAVFMSSVARNRGVSTDKVKNDFGRGGLLVGAAAVKAGLANGLGSLESIIAGKALMRPIAAIPSVVSTSTLSPTPAIASAPMNAPTVIARLAPADPIKSSWERVIAKFSATSELASKPMAKRHSQATTSFPPRPVGQQEAIASSPLARPATKGLWDETIAKLLRTSHV